MPLSVRAVDLCLLLVMKVMLTSNFYTFRYLDVNDFIYNVTSNTCDFVPQGAHQTDFSVIATYGIEFLLPVLGGLMSDKWFGELRCLRYCAVILLLVSLYVASMNYLQLLCHVALAYVGKVLVAVTNGLGMAIIVAAIFKTASNHLFNSTAVCMIYYASAAIGEFLGSLPTAIRTLDNNHDYTFIVCISALIFGGCTLLLRMEWLGEARPPFLMPRMSKIKRLAALTGPFCVLVWCYGAVRTVTSCMELRAFLGMQNHTKTAWCNVIVIGYDAGTFITSAIVALLCGKQLLSFGIGSIHWRLTVGLVIQLASRLSIFTLLLINSQEFLSSTAYIVIYGLSSVIDGCSNAVGLAAGYELVYLASPAEAKNIGMGIMFTVWSTGTVMTGLVIFLLMRLPHGNPILPQDGNVTDLHRLYVPHLILAIAVLLVLLYTNIFFKRQLRELSARLQDDESDPLRVLINNSQGQPSEYNSDTSESDE